MAKAFKNCRRFNPSIIEFHDGAFTFQDSVTVICKVKRTEVECEEAKNSGLPRYNWMGLKVGSASVYLA
jgi:hypothetical protein